MRLTAKRTFLGPLIFLTVFAACNALVGALRDTLRAQHAADLMSDAEFEDPKEKPRRDRSVAENLDQYWAHIPDARKNRLVVVVGMSQMHSINDRKFGDKMISELMDDELAPQGVRVFGLAAPNLDNEEALLYLLATTSQPETYPYAMIYGVCFDKFRNTDIRPGLQTFVRRRPGLLAAWGDLARRYARKYPAASAKMLASASDIVATAAKQDDGALETKIRVALGRWLPVVDGRKDLNAKLYTELYLLRNEVFNIKSVTKRPIMGARYELNQEFLGIIAEEAARRQVRLLPYIIPLNPSAESPYVGAEYAEFKRWYAEFTSAQSLPFVNWEALVPAQDWGLRNGEPDFKHFKAAGHRSTSRALVSQFGNILTQPTQGATP